MDRNSAESTFYVHQTLPGPYPDLRTLLFCRPHLRRLNAGFRPNGAVSCLSGMGTYPMATNSQSGTYIRCIRLLGMWSLYIRRAMVPITTSRELGQGSHYSEGVATNCAECLYLGKQVERSHCILPLRQCRCSTVPVTETCRFWNRTTAVERRKRCSLLGVFLQRRVGCTTVQRTYRFSGR